MAMLVVIGLSTTINPDPAQSEICSLPSEHAGMTFPIEKIDPDWACRLHAIIDNYTTSEPAFRQPHRTGAITAAFEPG